MEYRFEVVYRCPEQGVVSPTFTFGGLSHVRRHILAYDPEGFYQVTVKFNGIMLPANVIWDEDVFEMDVSHSERNEVYNQNYWIRDGF